MSSQRAPHLVVDTPISRSASFARPESWSTVLERTPIAVGPGRPTVVNGPRSGLLRDESSGYPITIAKVQRPALRVETLERPRLLDWLRVKVHSRVVLLLADAGYGKTTLLADFSRRSRIPTLWYRLDETDRDWTSFIAHLVAAGREHDPAFAPTTASLLGEIGVGGPTRESVFETFLRELPSIVVGGAVLILDDFHLVDDAADVRHIARELVARAPERLSIVFASRRPPTIPLSRLRAVGEVAELTTDDLRFDVDETARLFNETYGRRLDPDVLVDLAERTEGWIASLHLVQAALRDRSPGEIRRFVKTLNGADKEMYDYLAEEVVGELSLELQRFLMDTAILQVVTPDLAEVVSGHDAVDVARLIAAAERVTLLSRLSGAPRTHQRYHPLVREFLEARFRSLDGDEAVNTLHRRTAAATTDWRIAAHHYREAGDTEAMLASVSRAIPEIMGNGQYALAEAFIEPVPPDERPTGFGLITSRVEMQQGDYEAAMAASQAVLDSAADAIERDYALLNLITLNLNYGNAEATLSLGERLMGSTTDGNLRMIAELSIALVNAADDGDIEMVYRKLRTLSNAQRPTHRHQYGVTMHNLATISWAQGRPKDALREASEAIDALSATSASIELTSALVLRLTVLAATADWPAFEAMLADFEASAPAQRDPDASIDLADLMDSYAEPGEFLHLVRGLNVESHGPGFRRLLACAWARAHARRGEHEEAREVLREHVAPSAFILSASETLFTRAYVALAAGAGDSLELARLARAAALRQSAHRLARLSELLVIMHGHGSLESTIVSEARQAPWNLTFLADLVIRRLEGLTVEALGSVQRVAKLHPERWKSDLRLYIDSMGPDAPIQASRILEVIGDKTDVARLRTVARGKRRSAVDSNLGRSLARRVADRVVVEDQGRVSIRVGDVVIAGSDVRRKVLGLVCLLITRPTMSATRDQVLEALWPDLDPAVAVNSLNQTLYFLRRVFENPYVDDLSPGYVHHDSEIVWLDPELVSSRSTLCRDLIRSTERPASPDAVEAIVELYRGRFALDFEYEEWAGAYRDNLHAAYLEIVERAVVDDFAAGQYDRGISIARRVLEIDPSAEQIEVSLLRLYKATGAHAAAAEQYAHYATAMREDLGVDVPPLDAL